jgi:hypothetical protein
MSLVKKNFYDIIQNINDDNIAKHGRALPLHPNLLSVIRAELFANYHHVPNIDNLLDDIINEYRNSNTS